MYAVKTRDQILRHISVFIKTFVIIFVILLVLQLFLTTIVFQRVSYQRWEIFKWPLIYSFPITLIGTIINFFKYKKFPHFLPGREQKISIESRYSIDDIYDKIILRFNKMDSKSRISEKEIKIRTRFTASTWGESILVQLKSTKNGMHKYEIISKSSIPTTFIDYAINAKNLIDIRSILS